MCLHIIIIPVSTITRFGCFTFDMQTFKVNRDLYNFCSISGCSKDYSALADKLEVIYFFIYYAPLEAAIRVMNRFSVSFDYGAPRAVFREKLLSALRFIPCTYC
jgi:hypothetical protein